MNSNDNKIFQYPLASYFELLSEAHLLAPDAPAPHEAALATRITGLTCDSRIVSLGCIFICKGAHFLPAYLSSAIENGAVAYISETSYAEGAGATCIKVSNVRRAMALAADLAADHASTRIRTIGITGTKGKSSTAYMVRSILNETATDDHRCPVTGVMSSIDIFDGVEDFESHITTPDSDELHRHMANAVASGLTYMDMEVSSQALKYDRCLGVTFDVACFLNIGRDHISSIEHTDFEDYFSSKLKIFSQCKNAVVNLSSDHADRILKTAQEANIPGKLVTISVGDTESDFRAWNINPTKDGGLSFVCTHNNVDRTYYLKVPGIFNVENALAAIAISHILGIDAETIAAGLMKTIIPGRMEVFHSADNHVTVLVDYAHNALSFSKLFESVTLSYPNHFITSIFGSAGGKAQERRRDLPQIAGKYSDLVIFTEEDAGLEDVTEICEQLNSNLFEGAQGRIQIDRTKAITQAIEEAALREQPTLVLALAKGREERQKRGNEYITVLSDVEITQQALIAYNQQGKEN